MVSGSRRTARPCTGRSIGNLWASLTGEMSDHDILRAIELLDIDDQVWLVRYLTRNLTGTPAGVVTPSQRARMLKMVVFDRDRVGPWISIS